MFSLMAIEVVQREREREIREAVRRRQLRLLGRADPDLAPGADTARATRRERPGQPARLATP